MPDPATTTPAATTQASAETSTSGGVTATLSSTSSTVKPGLQTTEFWLTILTNVVGALMTEGVIGAGTEAAKIAGAALIVLGNLGYVYARSMVKSS